VAAAYTAFVIYGSWVPLNFQPLPLGDAFARFGQIQWLNLGVGHRADWVANILLFIPLTCTWLGVLWSRHWGARVLSSVVVWALASVLAVAIEFSQVFFPGRTISLNDILAETIGGGVGVLAWWLGGERLSRWFAELRQESRPLGAVDRVLVLYAAIVVLYALLPFDLTISATEVYRKFRDGAIVLTPFTFREARAADSVYSMASEVLLWIPMGVFVVRRWSLPLARAVITVATGALVLEVLQVFVYSRTSDVNDVIAASAGAVIGVVGARRSGLATAAGGSTQALPSGLLTTLVLVIGWAVGAAFVFLYPFDFNLSGEFIRSRLDRVPRVLFASYYFGSEYNAVTQVLRKMLYFLPLGAALAWGFAAVASAFGRALYALLGAAVVVAAAVGIEVAQVALPGKIVDATDAMLSCIGALAGWVLVSWVVRLGGRARTDAIVNSRDS
jgi:VanZ family protein